MDSSFSAAISLLLIAHSSFIYCSPTSRIDPVEMLKATIPETVTDHEIVHVKFVTRKNESDSAITWELKFRAFGKDINLFLHPPDSVLFTEHTPVIVSRIDETNPPNLITIKNDTVLETMGEMLQNNSYYASVVVGMDEYGNATVNGQIQSLGLIIRNVPASEENCTDYESKHVIFKYMTDVEANMKIQEIDLRSMPREIIYPEVLVAVDSDLYSMWGDVYLLGALEYIVAYWSGVDLRFRGLKNPKIRLHIAAIYLGSDERSLPHIQNAIIPDTDMIEETATIILALNFFYDLKTSQHIHFDMAVTMTKKTIMSKSDGTIAGSSVQSSVCNKYFDAQKIFPAVAVINDDGKFSSILASAREVTHLMGVHHGKDTANPDCMQNNGFIMADGTTKHTTNTSLFSPCSIEEFKDLLEDGSLKCLYNKPETASKRLPILTPGKIPSETQQCAFAGLGIPCEAPASESICVSLHCRNSFYQCKRITIGALDGTPCGFDESGLTKFCLGTHCVSSSEDNSPKKDGAQRIKEEKISVKNDVDTDFEMFVGAVPIPQTVYGRPPPRGLIDDGTGKMIEWKLYFNGAVILAMRHLLENIIDMIIQENWSDMTKRVFDVG